MAKNSTQYVCANCGANAPQMIGRCPVCGEWGTYEEEKAVSVMMEIPAAYADEIRRLIIQLQNQEKIA